MKQQSIFEIALKQQSKMAQEKKQYEIGQEVWKVQINKPKNESRYSTRQEGVHIQQNKIIGVSDFKVCLDDVWFTTLTNDSVKGHRRERKYNTYLEDVSVTIRAKDGLFEAGIFATLYTRKKPTKRTLNRIKNAITAEIEKDYYFLFEGVGKQIETMIDRYKF